MEVFIDRVGEENYNNFGSKMIINRYQGWGDIDVYFPEYNWTSKHKSYKEFKNGKIACLYEPRLYGHRYLGEGEYKTKQNGKHTKCYRTWNNMLYRCYSEEYKLAHETYIDVKVCEEWLNFQVFSLWYEENYYEIENENMQLDKDILHKGNKIYSPNTCVFVPQRINKLFTKNNKIRNELPIGVHFNKRSGNYKTECSVYDNEKKIKRIKRLGCYNTPKEAFKVYKQFKEQYIKQVADEYKDKIPKILYDAMYKYKVEITD